MPKTTLPIFTKKKGNYTKAIDGYKACLDLQEELQDTATICNTYFNIGTCYEELHKPVAARTYFETALGFASSINDVEIQPLSLIHLGNLALLRKEYPQAENFLNRAEKIVKTSGYRQVLVELYNAKTTLYEQQGNYQSALQAYKFKQSLTDSITNEKFRIQTNELKIQLQTDEKEQQIAIQRLEIKNKNRFLTLFTIFSLTAIALIIVLFRMWRQRQRQNEKLTKLNATKDKLFSIISHDLRAPAIAQKLAIESLSKKIELFADEEMKSGYRILKENTNEQVSVIENLMNWARMQTDKIKYEPQNFDIVSVISDEIKLYAVAARNKALEVHGNLPESCIVFADKQMIIIVLRNIVNNAVKFTRETGAITISCECNQHEALITVQDTGVGMSRQQIDAIYTSGQQVEVHFGTQGEKGTGLGLELCKELLEKNNSRLLIESREQQGTTIRFTLKKTEQ